MRELQQALGECRISIAPDTLGRLMEREGALDARGMVSAKSFAVRECLWQVYEGLGIGAGSGSGAAAHGRQRPWPHPGAACLPHAPPTLRRSC